GSDGRFLLPEYTLGWHCLAWTATYLQHHVGAPWRVPREQVDGVVDRVFAEYRPVAFFADPGSGFDESDGERY
ncbi:hypothetical protein KBZ21_50045, partial [Streptomyces sp. A73]|nr:hypothetical protein [Streptomyces sp. A73]